MARKQTLSELRLPKRILLQCEGSAGPGTFWESGLSISSSGAGIRIENCPDIHTLPWETAKELAAGCGIRDVVREVATMDEIYGIGGNFLPSIWCEGIKGVWAEMLKLAWTFDEDFRCNDLAIEILKLDDLQLAELHEGYGPFDTLDFVRRMRGILDRIEESVRMGEPLGQLLREAAPDGRVDLDALEESLAEWDEELNLEDEYHALIRERMIRRRNEILAPFSDAIESAVAIWRKENATPGGRHHSMLFWRRVAAIREYMSKFALRFDKLPQGAHDVVCPRGMWFGEERLQVDFDRLISEPQMSTNRDDADLTSDTDLTEE